MKPYYSERGIEIYHGDCLQVLPLIRADVFVADPPYGVNYKGSATKHSAKSGLGYSMFEDTPEYVRDIVLPALEIALSICQRGAVTPGLANRYLYPRPSAEGVIWYPSGANTGPWGFVTHQPIFYYGKCPYLAARKGSRPTGFQSTERAEFNGHPCPKPIGQMRWIVNRVSSEGETVLDFMCGSGTTLLAAQELGRKAIGIEIEERYCEIAAKRLSQEVLAFA